MNKTLAISLFSTWAIYLFFVSSEYAALIRMFVGSSIGISCAALWFSKRQKIQYTTNDGLWIDIEKSSPMNKGWYLVTDGHEVDYFFTYGEIKYNKFGKPVYGHDNKVITAWMPFPNPPEKL